MRRVSDSLMATVHIIGTVRGGDTVVAGLMGQRPADDDRPPYPSEQRVQIAMDQSQLLHYAEGFLIDGNSLLQRRIEIGFRGGIGQTADDEAALWLHRERDWLISDYPGVRESSAPG